MSRLDALRQIPIFCELSQGDLASLADQLGDVDLADGEELFAEGDRGESMYFVTTGCIEIRLKEGNGKSLTLARLEAGAYFGELALLDGQPRSAGAYACGGGASLLELRRDVLRDYLEERPNRAVAMLRTMADRLRETNQMLASHASRNVVEDYEKDRPWPDRLADRVAELNGSWTFVLLVAGTMGAWALINARGLLLAEPFDSYPYIFFNMVLAVMVAVQWPLIVMSQNRRAEKEKREAENDFQVNMKNEVACEDALAEIRQFREEWAGREDELLLIGQWLDELEGGESGPTCEPAATKDE